MAEEISLSADGGGGLSGYLKRKESLGWKKRFFTQEWDKLVAIDSKDALVCVIQLRAVTNIYKHPKNRLAFVVVTQERDHVLSADAAASVDYWTEGLRDAVHELTGRAPSNHAPPGTPKSPRVRAAASQASPRRFSFQRRTSTKTLTAAPASETVAAVPVATGETRKESPLAAALSPREKEVAKEAETAFLEFRRLRLKSQLEEVHSHDVDLVRTLGMQAEKRMRLQRRVQVLEAELRAEEEQGYQSSSDLDRQFGQVVGYVNEVAVKGIQPAHQRLQSMYARLLESGGGEEEELGRYVREFRRIMGVLEGALVLNKPLRTLEQTLQERQGELAAQCAALEQQVEEAQGALERVRESNATTRTFYEKSVRITNSLASLSALSSEFPAYLEAREDNKDLSNWIASLQLAQQSLLQHRDARVVDTLKRGGEEAKQGLVVGADGSLVAASIDKMLELLLTGQARSMLEMGFQTHFLLTFRTFISPVNLLEKVMLYYCSTGDSQEDERMLTPVRIRALNLLKSWIGFHLYDFSSSSMTRILHAFINETLKTTGYTNIADKLNAMLVGTSYPEPMACPAPLLPQNEEYTLLNLEPLEVARQLTMQDVALYQSIEAKDLVDQSWSSKDPKVARTVKEMISQFNKTAAWVQGTIVTEANLETRARIMGHMVDVAQACLELHNFNGAVKIMGSLSGQAVYRLKKTWARVSGASTKKYQAMKELLANNFRELRVLMESAAPPTIPYFGAYLTDLVYVGEMRTRIDGHLSLRKISLTGEAISKIIRAQKVFYWLQEVPRIRSMFLEQSKQLSDDEAYAQSLIIEPRG